MNAARRLRVMAVTALVASACVSTPTAGSTPSPSASPSAAASPTASPPAAKACAPANPCRALVTLRGVNSIVVRDITDINHPKTVSSLGPVSLPLFASGSEVSYFDYDSHNLIRTPLAGSPKTTVLNSTQFMGYLAWSPDGTTAVYLANPGSSMVLHAVGAGGDRVLDEGLPAMPAVGCESVFCTLAETTDVRLLYSPDGAHISLVENFINVKVFRLWTAGGKLLVANDSDVRWMSTWSGNGLYYRDANGVEVWRDGTTSSFLSGVAWIRPKASPTGGQIAYETRDARRLATTFVVDTTTRKIRELKKARFGPVFLTSRYIWYQGQRACVAADHCPTGWSVLPSGKTFIYDLQTGTEAESVITTVEDVWPHAA